MSQSAFDQLRAYIQQAEYILVLLGAGLSQPSGIPTFRGTVGRVWRGRDSAEFAQPKAFERDPVLVWAFYESRRMLALHARPNAGHFALTELAARKRNMLTITQNIDGLSERAGHVYPKLIPLHGSLFAVRCAKSECAFRDHNYTLQPTVPGMILPANSEDENVPLPIIDRDAIPKCPRCREGLLRPGVVWYSEKLPADLLDFVDGWLELVPRVDLMLVVGTTRNVFVGEAVQKGARIAYLNKEELVGGYEQGIVTEVGEDGEWFVRGDAALSLPALCGGW